MDMESDSTVVQILGPKKRVREWKKKNLCYCRWLNVLREEEEKKKKKNIEN